MSLKDLFEEKNTSNKSLYDVSAQDLVNSSDAESSLYLQAYLEDKKRLIPDLDLTDPKNFARFGSAELYYEKAFEHIQKFYPYDGSKYEKLAFSNSGSIFDLFILDKQYPKTTGFVSFSPAGPDYTGALTTGAQVSGFKNTNNAEYILFRGGPNGPQVGFSAKDDIKQSKANVFDESKFRASNLPMNMATGSTIEFWLKKEGFADTNAREMIFDLWNSAPITDTGSDEAYARMNVSCIQSSVNTITFFHQSGSVFHKADLDTGLSTIADNKWHHYAVSAVNSGNDLEVSLYVDGIFKEKSTGSNKATLATTGSMAAVLGATVTQMNGDSAGAIGYGKLSGSLDEFRYWKQARTSKEISRNWNGQVHGGTNTDDANTTLGVYYKFNEGITGTGSIDQKILDYSGRVTNGTFVGYDTLYTRSTESAIEQSGHGFREEGDPILYTFHPTVVEITNSLKSEGRAHDHLNVNSLQAMIPSWILEEENSRKDVTLKFLLQIMSTEFDELSMLITNQNNVKNLSYASGSITGSYTRAVPYSRRLLNSNGFITPEMFTQASFFEDLQGKNDNHQFSGSLENVKNLIYNNIYNNLITIQKSKGTHRAVKNLLHCIGIDEDIIKINLYANNSTYEIEDNFKARSVKSKLLDFGGQQSHFNANAYQYINADFSDSQNFISGTFTSGSETSLGYSVETEVVFAPNPNPGTRAFVLRSYGQLTSSLFGQRTAEDDAADNGNDLTFRTNDDSHFSVFAVRPELYSPHAKIVVTGSKIGEFETSEIKGLYDGDKYNIAFTMTPSKSGFHNAVSGASAAEVTYEAKVHVLSTTYDVIETDVSATKQLTYAQAVDFLQNNKRIYLGANRTNFTGSVIHQSDAKINSCRVWFHPLDKETLKAHNRDVSNYGVINPYENVNATSLTLGGLEVPKIETLALNWEFETNSTSDASGQMSILDISSGSAENRQKFGWLGKTVGKLHSARADFYPANDATAIDVDFISTAKQSLPEVNDSNDMTKILLEGDDVTFESQSRPVDVVFAVEKSFYQSMSEELLKFFSTIDDFHNLIGHPVNRYRQEYKQLGKLRQLLFEKFEDVAHIEKYVNYYKWFDTAINMMIRNLIPASAMFVDGISNVIESHVLERNKHWNKFPTLEMSADDPVATIKGVEELQYNWRIGHAPVPSALATSTFRAINSTFTNYSGLKFSLQSVDGTTKTYRFNTNSTPATGELTGDEVNITIRSLGIAGITSQVVAAVEGETGHNGKISTSRSTQSAPNDTVTFTQTIPGKRGNTPITLTSFSVVKATFNGGVTNTSFSGGEEIENKNCFWWKNRADRDDILSSGDANVDADRQAILDAITTDISGSGKRLVDISSGSKVKYEGLRYAHRSLSTTKNLVVDRLNSSDQTRKPHENRKHAFYKTAIASPFVSSSLTISGSDLRDFKDCNDVFRPAELNKTKYEFSAFVSASSGPIHKQQGHILFPFVLMSRPGASTSLGQAAELSTFKLDLELTNIHKDFVFHNDAVLQSPFTDAHVGGNQHRHTALNRGSDDHTNRAEAWALEVDAQNLRLVNPASAKGLKGGRQRPRATMLRDETAKRFLNIKNIKSTTGSLTLGNYDKDYQVFQSSNRKVNNLSFVENSGIDFGDELMQSPFISGTHDFALPVRTVNKNIFVERFNAPGGAETMARGMLDPESEQFSVYNGMNYRNMLVRSILHGRSGSLLTNHTEFGGTDATFGPLTASFHKINRNRQIRLETNALGAVVTASVFDNGYIQHAIPASDRQYSWITASLVDHALGTSAPLGYAPRSGKLPPASGLTSVSRDAFVFVSESLRGYVGTTAVQSAFRNNIQDVGLNHVGLNIWSYDPVTGSSNTLGLDLTAPVHEYNIGLAHAAHTAVSEDSEFSLALDLEQDYDLGLGAGSVPNREKGQGLLERAEGALTNGTALSLLALNLRRNGPFGYPSWKQIRVGDHPVARFNKRNNIISYVDGPTSLDNNVLGPKVLPMSPGSLRFAKQSPISTNHPLKFEMNSGLPFVYSFTNDTDYFADRRFEKQSLNAEQMKKRNNQTYKSMLDLYSNGSTFGSKNPVNGLSRLTYAETIYPPREFMHSSHSRGRENFEIPYWRNTRFDRSVPASSFTNSLGSTIAASGTVESAPNRNPTGYSVRVLVAKAAASTPQADIADPCSSRWPLDAGFISGTVHGPTGRASVNTIAAFATPSLVQRAYVTRQPLGLVPSGAFGQDRAGQKNSMFFLPAHQDTGELQAAYAHYHMGEISADANTNSLLNSVSSSIRLGQTINRRVIERKAGFDDVFIAGGDTNWDAGDQALAQGRSRIAAPFYEKYDDFSHELRSVGKSYSIVPEFRMSEHMDYYINTHDGDFTVPNGNIITLSGAAVDPTISPINRGIFSKVYSTTDFLKMFEIISTDHRDVLQSNGEAGKDGSPAAITIKCKALMKFLPYEGFYPMQRAMQLGTEFSRSYGDIVTLQGTEAHPRTMFNPFFAPGIMYNTLKSGIACDYPVFLSQSSGIQMSFHNVDNNDRMGGRKTSGSFDFRIPFEAMLDPVGQLGGRILIDQEPHPSASLNSSASFQSKEYTELYRMAAHNFFAECIGFYLQGNTQGTTAQSPTSGHMTRFLSRPDQEGTTFFNVEPIISDAGAAETTPKEYRMRIAMHNSNKLTDYASYFREMQRDFSGDTFSAQDGTATVSGTINGQGFVGTLQKQGLFYTDAIHKQSIIVYERSGSHPSRFIMPRKTDDTSPADLETRDLHNVPEDDLGGLNYVRGSSYGPPHSFSYNKVTSGGIADLYRLAFSSSIEDGGAVTYSPYTPPYFDGFSYLEYIFKPDRLGYHTADEILEKLRFKTVRLTNFLNIPTNQSGLTTDEIDNGAFFLTDIENAMSITASINPMQTFVQPGFTLDPDGAPTGVDPNITTTRLAIEPRFECPIFDYTGRTHSPTLPTFGSGSVVRGTWHQYGNLATGPRGVFMEVQDIPNQELKDIAQTGSFASLVGFDLGRKKLGRVATKRKVCEAVVAVPFTIASSGGENPIFFKINKSRFNVSALGAPPVAEITRLLGHMNKYVFPPQLDFIRNPDADAVAMYVFEFEHEFNKRDLQNMWQNLPPETLMDIKEPKLSEDSISHDLLPRNFFGSPNGLATNNPRTTINKNVKWFVFKVKQRAEKNYFKKTINDSDDLDFNFKLNPADSSDGGFEAPEFSFNWPYDFFSMVELAKLDVELDFE